MTHRRRFRLRWSDALLGFPSLELHVRRSFRRLPGLRTIRWSLGRAPGRLEAAARELAHPTDRVSAPPLVIRCFCAWSPGDASAATVRSTAPRSVAPRAAPCGDRRARTSPARDVAAALGRHIRWRSPSASGRHDSTFTCHAVHRAPVASPKGAMQRGVGDTATSASEGLRTMPASCLPAAAEFDPGANPGSSSLPPDGQARPGSVRPASADRAVPSFQTLCGAGVAACLACCSPSPGVPPTTPLRPFAPSGRDRRPSRRAAAAGHRGAYRMSSPTFSRPSGLAGDAPRLRRPAGVARGSTGSFPSRITAPVSSSSHSVKHHRSAPEPPRGPTTSTPLARRRPT